ncbi:MAG: hypothetical protein CL613_02160 [Aquimarina sp.]|nr:hypothetical protein [Aquimarina sp.]
MERTQNIRKKRLQGNQPHHNDLKKDLMHHSKELLKHPLVKGVAIVGAVYGILFISKYIIKEYAEVVIATKKLRNAHRL